MGPAIKLSLLAKRTICSKPSLGVSPRKVLEDSACLRQDTSFSGIKRRHGAGRVDSLIFRVA
jgi:hypothetical protein